MVDDHPPAAASMFLVTTSIACCSLSVGLALGPESLPGSEAFNRDPRDGRAARDARAGPRLDGLGAPADPASSCETSLYTCANEARQTHTNGPDPGDGPAHSVAYRLTSSSASPEASSGRPAGAGEVGELVGFCRSPGGRAGRWAPPARDGSAASHLGGLLRFMQAGPPPFSRAPMVQQNPQVINSTGHVGLRASTRQRVGKGGGLNDSSPCTLAARLGCTRR
jgi:hypothetical protein